MIDSTCTEIGARPMYARVLAAGSAGALVFNAKIWGRRVVWENLQFYQIPWQDLFKNCSRHERGLIQ